MAVSRGAARSHAGVSHRVPAERLLCCGPPLTSAQRCRQGTQACQHEWNNTNLRLSAPFAIKNTTSNLCRHSHSNANFASSMCWISPLIRFLDLNNALVILWSCLALENKGLVVHYVRYSSILTSACSLSGFLLIGICM